jgi:hypothetical protein
VLFRQVQALEGRTRVGVRLELRGAFGRSQLRDLARSGGYWTGRAGRLWFRLSGAARARQDPGGQQMSLTPDPARSTTWSWRSPAAGWTHLARPRPGLVRHRDRLGVGGARLLVPDRGVRRAARLRRADRAVEDHPERQQRNPPGEEYPRPAGRGARAGYDLSRCGRNS